MSTSVADMIGQLLAEHEKMYEKNLVSMADEIHYESF